MPFKIHRIKLCPPNAFTEVNSKKAVPRGYGLEFIDFNVGNPDTTSAPHIVDKLLETAGDPNTHRYSNSHNLPALQLANAKVAVSPWVAFDGYGDRFVRFVSVENEYRIRQTICGIRRFLQDCIILKISDSYAAAEL